MEMTEVNTKRSKTERGKRDEEDEDEEDGSDDATTTSGSYVLENKDRGMQSPTEEATEI